jgi:hypothetical protein
MPLKDNIILATLLALFAAQDLSNAVITSHPGSVRMTTNATLPAEIVNVPDRTSRGLVLASDRKQDGPVKGPQSSNPPAPPEPPTDPSDPASNRDLERPQRASPEAANDLFQLLKQAGPKGAKPK